MLDDILKRIEQGTTTVADARALRGYQNWLSARCNHNARNAEIDRADENLCCLMELDRAGGHADYPGQFSTTETP